MSTLLPGPAQAEAPAQLPANAPRLVVAIDFGTYASGYAFQWRSDYETDRLQIHCNTKWTASNFCTYKTPTCLLLNSNKNVVAFGYEAEKKFSELEINGENPENWYLFKHFKMSLYRREHITDDTPIEDDFGKHLPLVNVLAMSIKVMKDHVIKYLGDNGVPYPEAETKWVITVPAIWSDPAKQVTRNAAEKAGIKATNLSIALEPECAAIYCSQLPRDQLQIEGDGGKLQYIAAPGSIVMVVDMGGGTVDITTVQIDAGGTMKQIFGSGGGDWGGMKVNEKFMLLLRDIVGQEALSEWTKHNLMDEFELRMEFECRKREVKHKNEEGGNDRFAIKLPSTLKELWEKKEGKPVTEILQYKKDFGGKVEFMAGRLSFNPDIVREFFKETIDEILSYVEWAFKEKQNVGVPINCMVLIGGFAESNLVVKSIRDGLKDRGIPVVRPLNTEMAVLNGAVLFGQNEDIVTSRIMRHTYGVGMVMEFNPKCHKEEHKFTMNGKDMANNVFRKHITKGQEVKLGEWVSLKEYYPLDDKPSAIYMFTSDKTDPIHTKDEGCNFIGKVDFDFSKPTDGDAKKSPQAIELSLNFGGTELKLKVKDKNSGKTCIKSLKLL